MACLNVVHAQPLLKVLDSKQNFCFVKKGQHVKLTYFISNTGNQPLIITDAEVSCSCTTVDFPAQPIMPGTTANVVVSFDIKTVYNRQDRYVILHSNDRKGLTRLRYKGVVLTK